MENTKDIHNNFCLMLDIKNNDNFKSFMSKLYFELKNTNVDLSLEISVDPHITILYLDSSISTLYLSEFKSSFLRYLENLNKMISITFKQVSKFGDNSDVLVLELDSPDLSDMHYFVKNFMCERNLGEPTYNTYRPHITLFYMSKTNVHIPKIPPIKFNIDCFRISNN